jgi:ribulose-phosphate 3-epimerase
MSVNPGFGGQELIPGSFDRVRRLHASADGRQWLLEIALHGGINRGQHR